MNYKGREISPKGSVEISLDIATARRLSEYATAHCSGGPLELNALLGMVCEGVEKVDFWDFARKCVYVVPSNVSPNELFCDKDGPKDGMEGLAELGCVNISIYPLCSKENCKCYPRKE
jgi:hypothetical protein